ncbi:NAD(P)-dependent alcohol dehydrogenase [Alkalihalobacillus trypoxylicola]|uniref:Alcohol dehydrogenase n=1 Tax=Alkalihalobacillus trypoxylicola TaxID=519424 RepID=A0A161PYQ5_9BACI|nr:NAD(P)-dependent alcohol dehydrogenase [Alkalihalobacillus trypoxylicola]KYG27714.1 alcohol dehydrogenase [Alkalihalobacillus trypoxylicola]
MSQPLMTAAILEKPFEMTVKQIDIPKPGNDEALVKVYCIGICGSDVHYYEHGKIGRYVVEKPLILGHELAGEVVEVGEHVKDVQVGDRVAVEPGIPCGKCEYCKGGRYNLCPDVSFMATPPVDGAWAEYVSVRSDFLHKLPDDVSYEEGALIEPLSVGFHAMKRGRVQPGDSIFITGLGPIGLLTIEAAKLFGITEIYASDVLASRRELALDMGAKAVIDPIAENTEHQLDFLTDGNGIDVLIETSGNARVMSDSVKFVKRGGRIVYVGMPIEDKIPMDMLSLIDSEIDIMGLFRYVNTYPAVIKSLGQQGVSIEKVITDKYPLSEIKTAIEVARTEKEKSIKVMIYPGK